jgi:hypothetical protein
MSGAVALIRKYRRIHRHDREPSCGQITDMTVHCPTFVQNQEIPLQPLTDLIGAIVRG